MSAMEDGEKSRPRPAWLPAFALAAGGALAGALVAVALLAVPGFMPFVPRYACRISAPHGGGATEVRAASRASLLALRASSGVASELRAARDRIAERLHSWSEGPGPKNSLSAAAECAALLQVRAEIARTLAGEGTSAGSEGEPEEPPGFADGVERADRAVEQAAVAGDVATLRGALRAADQAESTWLAEGFSNAAQRYQNWELRERARGAELLLAAQVIESELEPEDLQRVAAWVPEMAGEMAPAAFATLQAATAGARLPDVTPIAGVWLWGALIGGLLGAAGGLGAGLRTPAARGIVRREGSAVGASTTVMDAPPEMSAELVATVATPAQTSAPIANPENGLHLVSGRRTSELARAACEIAGAALARGERALIADISRRLALDREFGAEARWGIAECLANALPVLGAVQSLGVPGLYLLSHGEGEIDEHADSLGTITRDARVHGFTVILVADPPALRAMGTALAPLSPHAVWVGKGLEVASTFSGIPFEIMSLPPTSEKPLEVLAARFPVVAAAAPPADAAAAPAIAPHDAVVLAAAAREAFANLKRPPVTIESDAKVRARLRFLMWMRRVRSERRTRTATAAGH